MVSQILNLFCFSQKLLNSISKSNSQFCSILDNLSNQITIDLNNIAPSIGGFTPTQTTDADNGVQQACSKAGGTPGYDTTMTGIIGQFTNVVNGSADAIRNTDDLCYSLSMISEPDQVDEGKK